MKKLTIAAVLIALSSAVVFGAGQVRAETQTSRLDSIVAKIATKFNLKTEDVQQVFDENRAEHRTQMQSNFEDRLTQSVTDGKINENQKQLILTKHQELIASHDNQDDSLTPQQHRDSMQQHHDELQSWADQNGIDISLILGGGNRGEGKGRGGMGMRMGGRSFDN